MSSPWYYGIDIVNELPADCEAFVYLITNKTNGMRYVGKKLAKFKQTKPPLKGKKNKRRSTVESDWKEYWGSSDRLKEDNFIREILHFCPTRGIASYLEAREQFERRVLEDDTYYNGIINVRIGGSQLLKEHLLSLSEDDSMMIGDNDNAVASEK